MSHLTLELLLISECFPTSVCPLTIVPFLHESPPYISVPSYTRVPFISVPSLVSMPSVWHQFEVLLWSFIILLLTICYAVHLLLIFCLWVLHSHRLSNFSLYLQLFLFSNLVPYDLIATHLGLCLGYIPVAHSGSTAFLHMFPFYWSTHLTTVQILYCLQHSYHSVSLHSLLPLPGMLDRTKEALSSFTMYMTCVLSYVPTLPL